jgi:hypothetical protein
MNCLDCSIQNLSSPAVAICVNCGAGVCAQHAQTLDRPVSHPASVGNWTSSQTRAIACAACATAVAVHPTPV